MKKSHKGMRKVSNPEIPVEAFYAIGGITVLGIGFFIWRATRNIGGIRQTFEQAVAIANEEGGDYAERAASAIRQAPQLNQGNQTNFVSEFNMGQGTSTPVTTPVATPVTTTGASTETSNTTSPETTQTASTSTPSVTEPTNQAPPTPSVEITDSQKNAILALAPGVETLRNPRTNYERTVTNMAEIQEYLIRAFNASTNQNVNSRAFSDGNIGRMTRALIYWTRSHPIFIERYGRSDQEPNFRVFLYPQFFDKLRWFTRQLEESHPSRVSSDQSSNQTYTEGRSYTPGLNYTPSGNQTSSSQTSSSQTSSSQTSSTPQISQTFTPPMPDWADVNSTNSDPGSTRFYTSTGIKVKSKKRKL